MFTTLPSEYVYGQFYDDIEMNDQSLGTNLIALVFFFFVMNSGQNYLFSSLQMLLYLNLFAWEKLVAVKMFSIRIVMSVVENLIPFSTIMTHMHCYIKKKVFVFLTNILCLKKLFSVIWTYFWIWPGNFLVGSQNIFIIFYIANDILLETCMGE